MAAKVDFEEHYSARLKANFYCKRDAGLKPRSSTENPNEFPLVAKATFCGALFGTAKAMPFRKKGRVHYPYDIGQS